MILPFLISYVSGILNLGPIHLLGGFNGGMMPSPTLRGTFTFMENSWLSTTKDLVKLPLRIFVWPLKPFPWILSIWICKYFLLTPFTKRKLHKSMPLLEIRSRLDSTKLTTPLWILRESRKVNIFFMNFLIFSRPFCTITRRFSLCKEISLSENKPCRLTSHLPLRTLLLRYMLFVRKW